MLRVDNLRRQEGLDVELHESRQVVALFVGQVVGAQVAHAFLGKRPAHVLVVAFLDGIQLAATLVDSLDLLDGGHAGLGIDDRRVDVAQVGQAAHAHHEELLQVGPEDGYEVQALEQGHRFVRALVQHALVEGEPGQLAVLHEDMGVQVVFVVVFFVDVQVLVVLVVQVLVFFVFFVRVAFGLVGVGGVGVVVGGVLALVGAIGFNGLFVDMLGGNAVLGFDGRPFPVGNRFVRRGLHGLGSGLVRRFGEVDFYVVETRVFIDGRGRGGICAALLASLGIVQEAGQRRCGDRLYGGVGRRLQGKHEIAFGLLGLVRRAGFGLRLQFSCGGVDIGFEIAARRERRFGGVGRLLFARIALCGVGI